jgi:GNAT superfamily N-acetyltransferase
MVSQEIAVTAFFPLYRHHCVLHDRDGDVWLFQERLDNGSYPRYTLRGKTLSSGPRYTAYLFGNFKCDYQSNRISVFIEDVITSKQGKHLGTWMLNRLIEFLRTAGKTVQFEEVYGDFKPRNEQQALAFFSRFGFVKRLLPTGREKITCGIGELHLVPIGDLKEIDFQEIVREWHVAKFGE